MKKRSSDLLDTMKFLKKDKDLPEENDIDSPGEEAPEIPEKLPNITHPKHTDDLDTTYNNWVKRPTPVLMGHMVNHLKPTINSSMITYAGGANPVLHGRAKKIAVDAIKSFKPNGKATLKSWVSLNLQGLQRYAASSTPMQAPERVRIDHSRMYKASQEYQSIYGHEPDDSTLADHTGLSQKRINYIRKVMVPVINEGMFTANDQSESEDGGIIPGIDSNEWQNIWAEYVYNDLDKINKKIFDMRMGRGKYKGKESSVEDIAKELGMSSAAVSQRTNKIADKLSEAFEMKDQL